MVKEYILIVMVIYMMVCLKMIQYNNKYIYSGMVMEYIKELMDQDMKVNGKMVKEMVKV